MYSRMRAVFRLLGVGWYVALCIAGGIYIGRWLDARLEINPLLTIVGLGIGICLALAGMYRMLMNVVRGVSGSNDGEQL